MDEVRREGIQNNSHLCDLIYFDPMKLKLSEVIRHHHDMVTHRRPSLHSCSGVLSSNLYTGFLVLLPENFLQRVEYFYGRFLVLNFARKTSDMLASI